MTTHNNTQQYTVQAAADLSGQSSRFAVITLAGTLFVGGAGSGRAAGINMTSARSGEFATYQYAGIVKCIAGAAVSTLGFALAPSSGGFMVAATSGGLTFGRALETANSGDLFQALVDFSKVAAWPGV
jgi:hypothetical protein